MSILLILLFWVSALKDFSAVQEPFRLSVIEQKVSFAQPGYYFALKETPLAEDHFIFVADALKRAYFVQNNKTVVLSHTMTVRSSKGFTAYFSAEDYMVVLRAVDEKMIDERTTGYTGTLDIKYKVKKYKFKIHGIQRT